VPWDEQHLVSGGELLGTRWLAGCARVLSASR